MPTKTTTSSPKRGSCKSIAWRVRVKGKSRWTDEAEIMVATFVEIIVGIKGRRTIRRCGQRSGGQ